MTKARNMKLLLPEKTITWRARGFESVIDLVFATPGITEAVKKCQVRPDLQHDSDHLPVMTETGLYMKEVSVVPKRAWKTAKPEEVATAAQEL